MAVGVALKEDVIVHNAADGLQGPSVPGVGAAVPTLEKVVEALKQCDQPTLKADVQLLKLVCAVGGALAAALEAGDKVAGGGRRPSGRPSSLTAASAQKG